MGGTMTYTYLVDGTKVAAVVNLSAPASTPTDNAILEQNISGMDLGLLDFGARYYDLFTTRWNAVDPLAYKYFSMSPYSYCGNDPVNMVDPLGMQPVNYIDSNGNKNISWSIVIMVKEPKPNSSARRMERHETYKQSLANSYLSQFNHYLNGNGEGVVNSSGERVFSTGKTRRAAFITISNGAPDGTESHELFHTTGIGDNGYKSGGVLNSPPEPILPEEIDQMWNSIPWKK